MLSSEEQIQIFYEVAMSIGTSLDMTPMLRRSITTILRKFNCRVGAVLFQEGSPGSLWRFRNRFSMPRNAEGLPDYQAALSQVPNDIDDRQLADFTASLPLTGQIAEGRYFFLLELPGLGIVMLLKSGGGIDPLIIKSLQPLLAKLSHACNACLQNEELVQHRNHLQELVEEKSGELLAANRQLRNEIDERKQAEEALVESEARYRELVQDSNSIILRWTPDGRVAFMNNFALNFFGYTEEEILGRHVIGALVPETESTGRDLCAFMADIAKHPDKYQYNINENMCKDGRRVWIAWTNKVLLDEEGNPTGALSIGSDITERKQAEEAMKKAMEEAEIANRELEKAVERANRLSLAAEVANKAKSDFLANMSHEIRTPLNGVVGMTELLEATELTAEQKNFVATARASGESLLTIINDILDFSKIEAGKLELEQIDFDLRHVAESVGELLAPRAHEKGLELAVLVRHQIPRRLNGDPGRLRQILTNLVGNAVKFTEKGEIVVELRVDEEREDAEKSDGRIPLILDVIDTGIGIPESVQANLFSSFTQADVSTTRRYGGTGLGLAISRQLAEAMGGALECFSEEGRGSRFRLRVALPIGADQDPSPKPVALKGVRVLVVDDIRANRLVFLEHLQGWNCEVVEAESGEEALARLREASKEKPFTVALIDFMMPGMDGKTLGRAIKNDPAIASTHLVLATSAPQRGDASKMRALGFAAYLIKPVRQSQLFDTMQHLLSAGPGPEKAAPRKLITSHSLKEAAEIKLLLAEDNIVNQKVAVGMLGKLGFHCDVVNNGQEALEALAQNAYDLILMDCQMPVLDGFEATRKIRTTENAGAHIPIVALTAMAMKDDEQSCLDAGMDAYITKPLSLKSLSSVVERFLTEKKDAPAE